MTGNRGLKMIEDNPGHSAWYIERFRSMAAEGADLDGEARLVDAMVGRGVRVLDAGCGPGRVGGRLAALGHTVVGVDIDPALIAAAEADHPGSTWLTADLSTLDLPAAGVDGPFDVIVCAGNVATFLDPATRRDVLVRFACIWHRPGAPWWGSGPAAATSSTSSLPTSIRPGYASTSGCRAGTFTPSMTRRTSWSRCSRASSERCRLDHRPTDDHREVAH